MRKFVTLLLLLLFFFTACSADEPFHDFEFNAAAGYIDRDDDTIERQLFAGETIRGEVQISDCRKDQRWASGFRMEIINVDESKSMAIGIVCAPESTVFKSNWVKIENLENIVDYSGEETEVKSRNSVIPFEVRINNQTLNFEIGDVSYNVDIGFKPHSTWFFGFGAQGTARYYILK